MSETSEVSGSDDQAVRQVLCPPVTSHQANTLQEFSPLKVQDDEDLEDHGHV